MRQNSNCYLNKIKDVPKLVTAAVENDEIVIERKPFKLKQTSVENYSTKKQTQNSSKDFLLK